MAPVQPSPKRLRTEGSSDNTSNPNAQTQIVPEVNRPSSSERPPDKWWLYFREFKGAEDAEMTSIFDRRFPLVDVSSLEITAGRIPELEKDVETQTSKVKELEAANQKLTEEKAEMSSTICTLQEEKAKLRSFKTWWPTPGRRWPTPGAGWRNISQVPDLEGEGRLRESDGENISQVQDLEGEGRLRESDGEILAKRWLTPRAGRRNISQVPDLEGDGRLRESDGEILAKSETWKAKADPENGKIIAKSQTWKAKVDSESRMEKYLPSPRLGRRWPTPRVGWRNISQVPDLEGEGRLRESDGEILAMSQTWKVMVDSESRMEKY
ncbi:putative disease resistance protein [Sesbania bispinosa]|nr:putative disease resistance protein [Sesbania bispinosa]